MRHDAHGLIITTDSDEGAAAFDHLVAGYLKYRADLPQRTKAVLEADPEFGLAHCVQGYMSMLAYKETVVPLAITSERLAGPCHGARARPCRRAGGVDRGRPRSRHRVLGGHIARAQARRDRLPAW